MRHTTMADLTRPKGTVRTLSQQEELPLLRDHLLRLDRTSRHDRFHGFMDDSFVARYAEKCANDGTVIIAYIEDGMVRGAAELHPPQQSDDGIPEIAFSVESTVRRQGVGTVLFRKLISVARAKGYKSLRITTGAGNDAMRAQDLVPIFRTAALSRTLFRAMNKVAGELTTADLTTMAAEVDGGAELSGVATRWLGEHSL